MRPRWHVLAVVTVLVALSGCGGQQPTTAETTTETEDAPSQEPADDGHVRATLSEWAIALEPTSVPAGTVTFVIDNAGAAEHELVVLRTDTAASDLPTDGDEVDEDAEGIEEVDEVEGIGPGADAELTVDLTSGSYAIICNLPGHYDQGMWTDLAVE
jgi:uncharacterized cupredoxin-like copper-binding protein